MLIPNVLCYNIVMRYDVEKYNKILKKYRITPTTLREDFLKIMQSKNLEGIFCDLSSQGVLKDIFPEFIPSIGLDQKNIHHAYTTDIHILKAVQYIANDKDIKQDKDILLWTMLLHDIGKPMALKKNLKRYNKYKFTKHEFYSAKLAKKVLKRFGLEKNKIKQIVALVREHEFFRYIKLYNMSTTGNRLNTKHTFALINKIGEHNFELLLACHRADYAAQSDYWKEHKNTINARATDMLEYYKKLKHANMNVNFK